jgi:Flp pilus assembly protein TadD
MLPRPSEVKPTAVPAAAPVQPKAGVFPAPSGAEPALAKSSALSPLLSVDGSERQAPSCDDLLARVPSEGEKAFDHVRAARQALVRGDVDGSQRGFCRAIRAGQTDAIVASELAQLLILRRDAAAAVPWARETVRLDPRSPRALTLLADALVRTGDLDEARSAWLGASKLTEDDRAGIDRMARAALAAADSALKERDPARAERLLRKVIAFQAENAAAHSKLGTALTRLGFPESAEAWTKRGAELSAPK